MKTYINKTIPVKSKDIIYIYVYAIKDNHFCLKNLTIIDLIFPSLHAMNAEIVIQLYKVNLSLPVKKNYYFYRQLKLKPKGKTHLRRRIWTPFQPSNHLSTK